MDKLTKFIDNQSNAGFISQTNGSNCFGAIIATLLLFGYIRANIYVMSILAIYSAYILSY